MQWAKLKVAQFNLFPIFLNVQFHIREGNISIQEWVDMLYSEKQFDTIVKMYRYIEPRGNYLHYHGVEDFLTDREMSLLFQQEEVKQRDISFLKKHCQQFYELQVEMLEIVKAIEEAKELNEKMAYLYGDSEFDAQDIFDYQQGLIEYALMELINQTSESLDSDLIHIDPYNIEDITAQEQDEYDEKLVQIIKEIEQHPEKYGFIARPGMPLFNWELFQQMTEYTQNAHIKEELDTRTGRYLYIADFAGNHTDKLLEGLKASHITRAKPIRDPQTKAYMYTLDFGGDFRAGLFGQLVQYAVESFDLYGELPRCALCKRPIQPNRHQKSQLNRNHRIYCVPSKNKDTNNKEITEITSSCYEEHRRKLQSEARSKQQRRKRDKQKREKRKETTVDLVFLNQYKLEQIEKGKTPVNLLDIGDVLIEETVNKYLK